MKKQEIIAKLTEIRDKRYCKCSRAKEVEKAYFDRVITEIKALPDDENITPYLKVSQEAVPIRNEDLRIRFVVYGYAINVAERVYAE